MTTKARSGRWSPWSWSYRQLCTAGPPLYPVQYIFIDINFSDTVIDMVEVTELEATVLDFRAIKN